MRRRRRLQGDAQELRHALRRRVATRQDHHRDRHNTVSRFLAAGCLDRLHVMVAPIILGAGGFGLTLPPIERADQALRMPICVHKVGDDVLFDCDLSAQRVALGAAKKST